LKLDKKFWVSHLGEGWTSKLRDTLRDPYMEKLMTFLQTEYALNTIYPEKKNVFRAFKACPFEKVKVVILGQDPYYNGDANGLAFANNPGTARPSKSLKKIFDNIERTYYDGLHLDFDFTLEQWAENGVLLLNTALTVRKNVPGSHTKQWKKFTLAVIEALNTYNPGMVFMLWGGHAKAFEPHLGNHHILTSEHPAYAVRQGNRDWQCDNFEEANVILMEKYGEKIYW
jgi:uracil-DNA glycosylase